MNQPKLENRQAQPYLGIRTSVKVKEIGRVLPPLHSQIADWMELRGIQPSGALFFRYLVIGLEELEMEVGVPVEKAVPGQGVIRAEALPAGCYAILLHTGPFSGLRDATQSLLEWAEKKGIEWQMGIAGDSEAWEARLENYLNVGLEKNPEKWETELAFLTADA